MPNDHLDRAKSRLHNGTTNEVARAQAEATLALAFEQQTANLIALIGKVHPNGAGVFSQPEIDKARHQVAERLGLS
jgi:hypothetical protein